ncbi:MAG: PQQ-dependent sugar dehydrogenase, partial [Patescibacteria group bacterium]
KYAFTLPDQYIDVNTMPAGIYRLIFNVDPRRHFIESRADNNTSVALVYIDPAKNIMKTNAAKPDMFVIRAKGSGALYVINDNGYRRRILSPDILGSYGFKSTNIADFEEMAFGRFPETDLIMKKGDTKVFSVATKKYIGLFSELESLGYKKESVHIVNDTDFKAYAVQVLAKDLFVPWDIAPLPDGDMLVTERSGAVRRLGKRTATIDIPAIHNIGEGGLMGIALHPDFVANKFVYLYFTTTDNGKSNRVQRFRLEGDQLIADKIIVRDIPAALYHDGGQIAFGADRMLYITTGDAETPALAQNLNSIAGKTLRFTPDGEIPSDNPFGTSVWSYGHRNAQGITWDAQGRMWETEHGRSGALSGLDELNLIEKGKNYGWPTIQGDETRAGMVTPVRHSGATTTWAPSGIAYLNGSLFFAGLRGSSLYEARIGTDGKVTAFKAHFANQYGRLRAVVVGNDGFLYVTTSNRDGRGTVRAGDDKILKINPEFLR